MSLLAAAVPVAVLVLAWDETAPAVRALLDAAGPAAPALGSVVVLVPAAAGELTQEEFLPLPTEPAPHSTAEKPDSPSEPVLAGEAGIPSEAAPISETATPLGTPPGLSGLLSSSPAPLIQLALGAAIEVALPEPAALLTAMHVLSLSSFSLPELSAVSHQALPRPIWQGSWAQPAAPYLGGQAAVASGEAQLPALAASQPTGAEEGAKSSENEFLPSPTLAALAPPAATVPAQAPAYPVAEIQSLDAEADLAPIAPDELAPGEATPAAQALSSAQADWTDALASLRTPLPLEEPAPATDLEDEAAYYAASVGEQPVASGPAELRPPSQPFAAPNLNFQVIQYARFAVPVALAQAPFAAIYAPAWPTWLAAQELRYRTRQPLVLHVATLAAGAGESVATATSWQAELQRQALQRADLILTETPELTCRLRHDLGLPPELVRTVPATDAAAVAQALRTAQLRPTLNPS